VAFSNSRVGILGLSYKENTPVIEESFGILVAKNLLNLNFQVYAFDPHINHLEFSKSNGIKFVDDPEKVIEFCDIILITLNYPAFKLINYRNFEGKIYLDYWNIFQGVNHGNSKLIKIGALNEKF
jgi:UDP-N-acetyl-D-mannosaminuronate dehydrogenase